MQRCFNARPEDLRIVLADPLVIFGGAQFDNCWEPVRVMIRRLTGGALNLPEHPEEVLAMRDELAVRLDWPREKLCGGDIALMRDQYRDGRQHVGLLTDAFKVLHWSHKPGEERGRMVIDPVARLRRAGVLEGFLRLKVLAEVSGHRIRMTLEAFDGADC